MDPVLRHRVIGIVVLLGLAAIVLPLLLDGDNAGNLLMDTRIPVPPEVPDAQPMLAQAPDTLPEAQAAIAEAHVPAEPEAIAPEPVSPTGGAAPAGVAAVTGSPPGAPPQAVPSPVAPAAAPVQPMASTTAASASAPAASVTTLKPDAHLAAIAEAWDVQLAALSSEQNANTLQSQLASAGFKARVVRAGALFRVLVGPEVRREDAIALRDKLGADSRFRKSKGMLVRYVP